MKNEQRKNVSIVGFLKENKKSNKRPEIIYKIIVKENFIDIVKYLSLHIEKVDQISREIDSEL